MRRPVLLVDDSKDSEEAIALFEKNDQPYVKYHIKNFEESCCGELPTTRAPSVFAPEGVFKGLQGVKSYLAAEKQENNESAYW